MLTFSFDIGYASIGWAVISDAPNNELEPNVEACGSVIFQADDCLASKRREHRRLHRNIRSRKQRINRIGLLLEGCNLISKETREATGHGAPFYLANEALLGNRQLSTNEIWHVLRWYAHNRGYDGNSKWSNSGDSDENSDDTKKVTAAKELMKKHNSTSMAETICKELELTPNRKKANLTSKSNAYKTLGVAFPRKTIIDEVTKILNLAKAYIPGLTQDIIDLLIQESDLTAEQRIALRQFGIHLPKRYQGSILFGQLIPRFDNRIISSCPITWAKVYEEELKKGSSEKIAKHQADKLSKVPSANCPEFYEYRLARILANLRADDKPLSPEIRLSLMNLARKNGKLTNESISNEITKFQPNDKTNVKELLTIVPDSENALILDPVITSLKDTKSNDIKTLFKTLSEPVQKITLNKLRHGRKCKPLELLNMMKKYGEDTKALEKLIDKKNKNSGNSPHWGKKSIKIKFAGRAPYAKPILRQVVEEVLQGYDPTRPAKSSNHPDGEEKANDGCLYCLADPNSSTNLYQSKRALDNMTNNHRVRHRLHILKRLVDDMVKEFAHGDSSLVSHICVEIGREVSEFSGKTEQEIQRNLGLEMKAHKDAVKHLENNLPEGTKITATLIRKCRIARSMNWTCPYTGQTYSALDLANMVFEHIIPRSFRQTDALSALTLTWPEVNDMKKQRTGYEFISNFQTQLVPGRKNLTISSLNTYKDFVDSLCNAEKIKRKKKKGEYITSDEKFQLIRQKLFSLQHISNKTQAKQSIGMTPGMMTQSSHLMKLAALELKKILPSATIDYIPGGITALVREKWRVLGCFTQLCPELKNKKEKIIKEDLRNTTYLHHASDACVLGLIPHIIPNHRGGILRHALLQRNFDKTYTKDLQNDPKRRYYLLNITDEKRKIQLKDLPPSIKENISQKLLEQRVVRHIPSDRSGAKLKENIQRIVSIKGEGDEALVTLKKSSSEVVDGKRKYTQTTKEGIKASKLIGVFPSGESKLKKIKGAIEISDKNGNYGLSLDPKPTVIRHFKVQKKIQELVAQNNGKTIRILRQGMIIKLHSDEEPKRNGLWRIVSIKDAKDGIKLDLQRPHSALDVKIANINNWRDVLVKSLLNKYNLLIPKNSYTGINTK